MRSIFRIILTSVSLVPLWLTIATADEAPRVVMAEKHRALFKEHCVSCHGPEKQEGKFRVDDLPFAIHNVETAEKWQKVLNAMNSGEMPPEDETQPAKAAKADFLDDLAHAMVAARRILSDQNGATTMRRLNRREYRNTIRDLLGVELNVMDLPSDTSTSGFDTVGANLFMSANQFEQYLVLGRQAMDEAFAIQARTGSVLKVRNETEKSSFEFFTKRTAEAEAARERFTRWATAVKEAAGRPANRETVAAITKGVQNDATLRANWQKITGAPAPEDFGFNQGNGPSGRLRVAEAAGTATLLPYYKKYLTLPGLETGAYLTLLADGPAWNSYFWINAHPGWPAGDYLIRCRAAATPHATGERRFLELADHVKRGEVISTHEVSGTLENPQVIEIPIKLSKGGDPRQREFMLRERGGETRKRLDDAIKANGVGPEFALWVDWIEIERVPSQVVPPGMKALASVILDAKASPPAQAVVRAAIERFTVEAFRGRVPATSYLDRLLQLYETRLKAGDKHEAALKQTLAVVLASPPFLYLAEPIGKTSRKSLTGSELASRLSYFLWGSPPDATLRELGSSGELLRPEVLQAQTTRLLDDPRSAGFTKPFTQQWLGLDRLDFFQFNRQLFPQFDAATELSARQEMHETIAHVVRQNTPLSDLLKADYVVINSVLADYYGLEGVTGDEFRKVPVPKDSPRGGLIGMAAILAMGGNGEYTSPVERGVWVLRKLVNDPPPPAPANVPAIGRLAEQVLDTRQRILAHQDEPQCASCHRKIDPVGFGLENFNAVGQWRTEDAYQVMLGGRPVNGKRKTWTIDPSGVLYKGPEFKDYFELRDIIATKSTPFARAFSAALIEYALGRPCGFSDEPLIDEMMKRAGGKKLAAREFIHALIDSTAFQTK